MVMWFTAETQNAEDPKRRRRGRKVPPTVTAINRTRRLALMSDNTVLPIVAFLDFEGDETDVPDEAVHFRAGTDERGYWGGPVGLFERQTRH